ncbi:MAG: thermonuclease family protein [Candidatus Omnitrophica bacterium]|nr:thermonuclease family protein [Candidatus Omnitrophota bacterium]
MRNNTNKRHWIPAFAGMTTLILAFVTPAFSAPEVQTYDQLLNAIRDVRVETQNRIEKAVDQEKVREAWETGKLIDEHVLQHKDRADYGEKVLQRLAVDIGSSETELRFMLQFFRTYPIHRPADELSWSHHQALLAINDDKERQQMTEKAVREHWNRDQVREEVQRHNRRVETEKFPAATPGKVYTYRVVKATAGPYLGQLGVDLGFSNYFQPDGINQFKEGDVVTLLNGKLQSAANSERFTYTAYVTEVIDGDTFHALVDLGFKIVTDQKLRLRGLDAPEIDSADGREAKEFLEKHGVRPGARILVKTVKSDKYDRYLADVWTLRSDQASSGSARTPGDERFVDGNYINQQLFDEGLAVKVNE